MFAFKLLFLESSQDSIKLERFSSIISKHIEGLNLNSSAYAHCRLEFSQLWELLSRENRWN